MPKQHEFTTTLTWTGNQGTGTDHYTHYERSHQISIAGKPDLPASSAPAFRGDGTKHNPEDLLVASLSSCHMLWYLHLCADAGIIVTAYTDQATGTLTQTAGGGGQFTNVTLHPAVTVQDAAMIEKANEIHHKAHELCFIANSVNFPVLIEPTAHT